MHRSDVFAVLLPLALAALPAHATGRCDGADRSEADAGAQCDRAPASSEQAGTSLDCDHPRDADEAAARVASGYGVVASGRSDATVRHCNVRGFRYGLYLAGATPATGRGANATAH